MQPIRIGTRGSTLALWQANWVARELERHGFATQILEISTSGDRDQQGAIANLGAQGVFTKEIQRALIAGTIDLAVHSLKDLPTDPVEQLEFVASPKRAAVRDAFVSPVAETLNELPHGAKIGTGSVRRKSQILNLYGDKYEIHDIRGNVETRLRKVDSGEYDATILAEAGLVRLGFQDRIVSYLEPPMFMPAIGQGALGLEIRIDDDATRTAVMHLNDTKTYAAVIAERSLLAALRGGCLAPVAALGIFEQTQLTLVARVLSPDGSQKIDVTQSIAVDCLKPIDAIKQIAITLGETVAAKFVRQGATAFIEQCR